MTTINDLRIAIKEHEKFNMLLTDKQETTMKEELDVLLKKINDEFNRQLNVATRFGTDEEKKIREERFRGKVGVLFPLNMLKSKRDQNKFIKLWTQYGDYLENIGKYVEVQGNLWTAFNNNMNSRR